MGKAGVLRRLFPKRPKPRQFPEENATGLAAAVRTSVAARVKMNGLMDAAAANRKHRIAGLVRPLVDLKTLSAEGEHFRHERHAFQLAVLVEGCEDLFPATDLNPIADTQVAIFGIHSRAPVAGDSMAWPAVFSLATTPAAPDAGCISW